MATTERKIVVSRVAHVYSKNHMGLSVADLGIEASTAAHIVHGLRVRVRVRNGVEVRVRVGAGVRVRLGWISGRVRVRVEVTIRVILGLGSGPRCRG